MVDRLRSAGRSDVLRLCGHADVNSDLEVILLLADEGLVGHGEDEAFICVDVVGRRRPGNTEEEPIRPGSGAGVLSTTLISWFCTHSVW